MFTNSRYARCRYLNSRFLFVDPYGPKTVRFDLRSERIIRNRRSDPRPWWRLKAPSLACSTASTSGYRWCSNTSAVALCGRSRSVCPAAPNDPVLPRNSEWASRWKQAKKDTESTIIGSQINPRSGFRDMCGGEARFAFSL